MSDAAQDASQTRFLTSSAAVLLAIAGDPSATVRAMADHVGLTERRAAQIIRDLREDGFITIERIGRRSRYTIKTDQRLQDAFTKGMTIGGFIRAFEHR